jgi:hypothetical protein
MFSSVIKRSRPSALTKCSRSGQCLSFPFFGVQEPQRRDLADLFIGDRVGRVGHLPRISATRRHETRIGGDTRWGRPRAEGIRWSKADSPMDRACRQPWLAVARRGEPAVASLPYEDTEPGGRTPRGSRISTVANAVQPTGCAMLDDHTTAVVQRYLDELGGDSPADPIVRALLDRSVRRLHLLCATLLHRSYPRLTRPPLNLQADELLGAIAERLLKALHEARPRTVRQVFALANQHMRWELNDLARRLDDRPAAAELSEGRGSSSCQSRRNRKPITCSVLPTPSLVADIVDRFKRASTAGQQVSLKPRQSW